MELGDSRRRKSQSNVSSLEPVSQSLVATISRLSFWGAIALPAVYLPLLAHGLSGLRDLVLFLVLFALHVLALIGGRHHAIGRR